MADTCIHEAGHAVMCWYLEIDLTSVSVVPDEDYLGRCLHLNPLRGIDTLDATAVDVGEVDTIACHKYVMIALAGAEACRVVGDNRPGDGAGKDNKEAFDVCLRLSRSDAEARAMMRWLRLRAFGILSVPYAEAALIALANRLRERPTIEGPEALAAILGAFQAEPAGASTSTSS